MRDKVSEDDWDEEATYCGQRDHQTRCRTHVLVFDIADPGRYRQPGRKAEDEEETDSDPNKSDRWQRRCHGIMRSSLSIDWAQAMKRSDNKDTGNQRLVVVTAEKRRGPERMPNICDAALVLRVSL
jgi:hypothetical protein